MKMQNLLRWWLTAGTTTVLAAFTGAGPLPGNWYNGASLKEEFPFLPQQVFDDFEQATRLHVKAISSRQNGDFVKARNAYLKLADVHLPDRQIDLLHDSAVVTYNVYKLCLAWGNKDVADKYKARYDELIRQRQHEE